MSCCSAGVRTPCQLPVRTGEPRLWRSPRPNPARLLTPAAGAVWCSPQPCTCAPTPTRLTTKADSTLHVGMANVKQPRHDNLKARCFAKPQVLSEESYTPCKCPAALVSPLCTTLFPTPSSTSTPASLPASLARLWKVRDTTRELRVFPGIMRVWSWAECHIIGLHVLRPTWIMSQAGQRAVSFHALVVLLLALVTTAGALTQSIGNTGPDLVEGPGLVKGPDRHRANDLVCFGSKC